MKQPGAYAKEVKKLPIDLTLSVNPLGCSPRVVKALKNLTAKDLSQYPDVTSFMTTVSKKYGVPKDTIVIGSGSEQLIKLVSQVFLGANKTALVESSSFFLFSFEPTLAGARVELFDTKNVSTARKRPALLFIANPTTPGGIDRTNKQILSIIRKIRPEVAIVDEANAEFRTESMLDALPRTPNLIVLRTLSKTIGIAGLRIGFAIGPKNLMDTLRRAQQPFPVSTITLQAAVVALEDKKFIKKTLAFVKKEREFMMKNLVQRGFRVDPSVTNNIYATRADSKKIISLLASRGVGVIDGNFFPGNKTPGFRISVKDRKTNNAFLTILDEVLAGLTKNKLLPSKGARLSLP